MNPMPSMFLLGFFFGAVLIGFVWMRSDLCRWGREASLRQSRDQAAEELAAVKRRGQWAAKYIADPDTAGPPPPPAPPPNVLRVNRGLGSSDKEAI